ncbi:MAG: hypothetical protein WCK86_12470 [Planctomycetia bacterium]
MIPRAVTESACLGDFVLTNVPVSAKMSDSRHGRVLMFAVQIAGRRCRFERGAVFETRGGLKVQRATF